MAKKSGLRITAASVVCLICTGTTSVRAAEGSYVAGLAPYERPANAPRLTADTPLQRERALRGVSAPIPQSIEKFLQHQGGWFNPFLHPGMTGPYDLRGWHSQAQQEPHQ